MRNTTLLSAIIIGLSCLFVTGSASFAQSIESMPPVVVKTVPQAGRTDVAPGVVDIQVTFSKDMTDNSWSWSTAWKDSTPPIIGKPRYESDHRTATIKVKLESGKTYGYWINSEKFRGFRDTQGHPAVPYLLVFQTSTEAASAQSVTSRATAAAEAWLQLPDAGKYDQCWQEMADYARNAVSQADFVKLLESFRTPLGKVVSRKLQSADYATSLPNAPDGEYVVLKFETQFENKQAAIETVTPMMEKDGKWKVSGYYIK